MKNIITQDGCWNCKFHISEDTFETWAEWPEWFCNFTNDCPVNKKDCSIDELFRLIACWKIDHQIKPWQKCDHWKHIKKKQEINEIGWFDNE